MRWLPLLLLLGCTDAGLYHLSDLPIEANRVALNGRVCTEDPDKARFPTRLIFVVDQAGGPLYAEYDPDGERVDLLSRVVQSALSRPEYAVAIVGYGGQVIKLAPEEGQFSRNPGELLNAINRLSLPQGCVGGGRCRLYDDALRVVGTLIEDDLAALPAGERVLTRYEVVLMNAGPAAPLARTKDCCAPGDRTCLDAGENPRSMTCQAQLDALRAESLVELVDRWGAAGLRLHVAQLGADASSDQHPALINAQRGLAFAGGGRYAYFAPGSVLDVTPLGLFDRLGGLRAKQLVVANLNALPSPNGFVPDSDADGLPDHVEAETGTDPRDPDSDDDGVNDLVEILAGFSPNAPDEFVPCLLADPERDDDRDGLNDCEEALLGTDPSLVDTDGDALPDRLEVALGTNYLDADGVADADKDGVSNGDEVRERTDPRTVDLADRLGDAYRYDVIDEGVSSEPIASALEQLTGVEIIDVSAGSTPGVGVIRFTPGEPPSLSWRDAGDEGIGAPVPIEADGIYELPSSSYAPIQGEEGRTISVRIYVDQLPPREVDERARIVFRDRHCLSYTVRNIRLVSTLPPVGGTQGGENQLLLYFAQAPPSRPEAPGPYRMAFVPMRYIPPSFRVPEGAVLEVEDSEFVTARPSRLSVGDL